MAISLKEQLQQSRQLLTEVHYQADLTNGTKSFWDFYAMYALWYSIGSGFDEYHKGKYENPIRVPHMRKKVVDDVMEQVSRQVARGLVTYLKNASLMELKHVIAHSKFREFRKELLQSYNINKTISKEEFSIILKKHMPKVSIDLAQKLLKFGKFYSPMTGFGYKTDTDDISDFSQGAITQLQGKDDVKPSPDVSTEPEPTAEPDPSQIEEPPGEEIPDYPDYEYPSGEFDPTDPFDKQKKKLKEEMSSEQLGKSEIRNINTVRIKAGMSMQDVIDAYDKIAWEAGSNYHFSHTNPSWGGPSWGEGLRSAMTGRRQLQNYSTKDLVAIIDHIYDMHHNTGTILNKGSMHVEAEDLDARARIKDPARFIPHVSGLVRGLIINNLPYLSKDPTEELNKEKQTTRRGKRLTPDQEKVLHDMGFKWSEFGGNYIIDMPIEGKGKKKGESLRRDILYTAAANPNGKFYTWDEDHTEINDFNIFEEMADYLKHIKHNFASSGYVSSKAVDTYEKLHPKIDFTPEQVAQLNKIGWKKDIYSKYVFKELSSDSQSYAYNNGTFSYLPNGTTNNAKLFDNFEDLLAHLTANVKKTFTLSPEEINDLTALMEKETPPVGSEKYVVSQKYNGLVEVVTMLNPNKPLFQVGKQISTYTPHITGAGTYTIFHHIYTHVEERNIVEWKNTLDYIAKNIKTLLSTNSLPPQYTTSTPPPTKTPWPTHSMPTTSPSSVALPANSLSKASYIAHKGINTPPKHTIRLTTDDEAKVANVGFNPIMTGGDIWYVHKGTKDAIKFYPNDLATLMLSKKGITTKMSIEKMLNWLPTKYTSVSSVSPIDAPKTPTTTPQLGVKAGSMFESRIAAAGFSWDDSSKYYRDGKNLLKIYPDRSSSVDILKILPDGISKTTNKSFHNLIELATYLQNQYPKDKQG